MTRPSPTMAAPLHPLASAFTALVCIGALLAPPIAAAQEPETPPAGESPPAVPEASAQPANTPVPPDSDAEAKRLYTNGAELYEEGRYEQAILAFREAHALSGRHTLLKNVANAQERMGELQAAVDTLNEYRVYAETGEKDALATRIRVLEERISKEREARMQAAAAAPQRIAPSTTEQRSNPVKWVLLGGGGALAAGFGAATYVTYSNGQDAREEADELAYDTQRNLNTITGALTILGGGLVGVGIALPASRNVSITPTGTGLNFAGRF